MNALAILELLQPLVFQESQADALNLCLEPFFDFLKVFGSLIACMYIDMYWWCKILAKKFLKMLNCSKFF